MEDSVGLYSHGGELIGLDLDILVEKAGGRFKFVTLIQRRMRDLQRGAPPLIERPSGSLMQIALEEYYQDKIWPVQGEEAEKLRAAREKEHSARPSLRPPPGGAAGAGSSGGAGTTPKAGA